MYDLFFFFNDTATTEIYTLSLHDALPIYKEQLKQQGKSEPVMHKILEGKMNKFYEQVCLINQPYIKDDKRKIKDLVDEATAKLGEKIEIKKMIVFVLQKSHW